MVLLVLLLLVLRLFLDRTELPIGKNVEVTGKVKEEPRIIGQSQYLKIGEVQIRTNRFPEYHFADILTVQGAISKEGRMNFPKIAKIRESKGIIPLLFELRRKLIQTANGLWPEPLSSLVSGIVLGNNSLSQEFQEALRKTGTLHIVVVSGQNVTMLAGFIFLLVPHFSRRVVVALIIGAVSLYTVLSGLQPPAIRAAIMGTLAYGASLFGRERNSFWGLFLAALLMLFFSPRLISDISFQLSFAATLGIMTLAPHAQKFIRLPQFLRENLIVTICAWLFTAPLLAYYFSQFTPITPLSNFLILPFVPAIMILGALSIFLGLIFGPLGEIFSLITTVPAGLVAIFVDKLSLFSWATIFVSIPLFLVFFYYFCLLVLVLWITKRSYLPQR